MSLFINIVMVGSGVAAAVLVVKAKNVTWAKPAAMACAILALALGIGKIMLSDGNTTQNALAAHARYEKKCGAYLGETLAARYPGARVVILTPPRLMSTGSAASYAPQHLVDSLQAALQGKVASVAVQALEVPEEVKARYQATGAGSDEAGGEDLLMSETILMETSTRFDDRGLAKLLEELREEADLVISTIDLNRGVDTGALPPPGQAPALVLVNAMVTDVRGALQSTCLDAIALHRVDSKAWQPGAQVPDRAEEAFNLRYLLVTRDNVESLAGQLPQR